MNKKIYDNCLLLAHDGTKLAYVTERKANWYVKNGLGTIASDENETLIVKLNLNDPKYAKRLEQIKSEESSCEIKENKCVVCGSEENLSKHHILPYCFRKHLPVEYKKHKSEDVVALCIPCHRKYEKIANVKKKKLISENQDPNRDKILELKKVMKYIFVFLNRKPEDKDYDIANEYILENFPNKNKEELAEIGKKIHEEIFNNSCHNGSVYKNISDSIIKNGKIEIDKFTLDWYNHFVNEMSPKFWPQLDDCLKKFK